MGLDDDMWRFIEDLGLFFEAEGLSRTAGRLVGLLLVEQNPLSLDEMAALLEMSKASISTNIRLIEHYGMVERKSFPGDRRDHYQLTDDPWEQVTEISIKRARDMIELAEKGLAAADSREETARKQLTELREFYALLAAELERILAQWHSRQDD